MLEEKSDAWVCGDATHGWHFIDLFWVDDDYEEHVDEALIYVDPIDTCDFPLAPEDRRSIDFCDNRIWNGLDWDKGVFSHNWAKLHLLGDDVRYICGQCGEIVVHTVVTRSDGSYLDSVEYE